MPGRKYFRDRRSLVAAGGTYDEITFDPNLADRRCHINRLAVEDEDHAPTGDIRVYVKGHGYAHWLLEQDSPAAATLYWDTDGTFLVMGESLVARFTGASLNDPLHLYLEGWWEKLEEQG